MLKLKIAYSGIYSTWSREKNLNYKKKDTGIIDPKDAISIM